MEGRRLFAWLQNFRRIVVRYERFAENFLGVFHLASCLILFRDLDDFDFQVDRSSCLRLASASPSQPRRSLSDGTLDKYGLISRIGVPSSMSTPAT